jgi:uncharacterized membrane protein
VNKAGIEAELHPGFYFVSRIFGPNVGPLLGAAGKAIAAFVVAIYYRRFAAYILLAPTIISLWAAWYNIWGIHTYVPLIFNWMPR